MKLPKFDRQDGYASAYLAIVIGVMLIGLGLLLAGCAPKSGTVYDRKYYPQSTSYSYDCVVYNDKGLCTRRMSTLHITPSSWYLCLDDGVDRGCRQVDQLTYHDYPPGTKYAG